MRVPVGAHSLLLIEQFPLKSSEWHFEAINEDPIHGVQSKPNGIEFHVYLFIA